MLVPQSDEVTPLLGSVDKYKSPWKRLAEAWDFRQNVRDILVRAGGASAARLSPLDGIRACAFLWVCALHLETLYKDYVGKTGCPVASGYSYNLMCAMILSGECGVMMFFVLSGFLIPHILLSALRKDMSLGYWSFLWRRFLRIWPSLNFYVLVSTTMATWAFRGEYHYLATDLFSSCFINSSTSEVWWSNLIFATNLTKCWKSDAAICQSHLWTVSAEYQMYLVTPPFVYLYAVHKRLGYLAVCGLVVGGMYLRIYETQLFCSSCWNNTMWTNIPYYAVGMLVSFSYQDNQCWWLLDWVRTQSRPVKMSFELLVGGSLCLTLMRWIYATEIFHWKLIELYGANSSCMYLAVACVTGVIIRVAIDPDMSNGLFASVLGSPLLYPFATLSYTGYLFSYVASLDIVLLYNYFGIWQRQLSTWEYTRTFALYMAILLLYASAASVLIERPFMKLR